MKPSVFLKLAAVALLTVAAAAGCKKTPKNVTPISGVTTRIPAGAAGNVITNDPSLSPPLQGPGTGFTPPPQSRPTDTTLTPARPFSEPLVPPPATFDGGPIRSASADLRDFEGMTMDRNAFAGNTMHFDYDKAVVKSTELGKLQPVIAALKASPQNKLLIEGHCDERGTEEYNRALGERRALAIRERLAKAGISPDRLRTLSFGEDKPAELGHTEAAWHKNRRGELVLLRPKN